ncbi:MAG: 30S ribosomal protein S7 [Candidatus Omnitrophica bacterium]|jgi:small subunit ribosomal protein S7|nr:30S ribosomal protein S7 [Candidatus Omnitrophota bacterium]
MRRRRAEKREVMPDARFNSQLVGKFINMIMVQGKKAKAEAIVYNALDIISEKTGNKNSVEVFTRAIENARPLLEVKSRRIGGATYQVPIEVKPKRGIFLAMMWIKKFARDKKGRPMEQRLAQELLDAYNKEGQTMKKREDTHKMAEANKAFSHYRW